MARVYQLPAGVKLEKWFPAHMRSGMKQMQSKLVSVDCFLEVHDARLPFTGRNVNFNRLLFQGRPHILLLNKADLVHQSNVTSSVEQMRRSLDGCTNVLHGSLKGDRRYCAAISVMNAIREITQNVNRFHRQGRVDYNVMLVGIPNVGKSTVINSLRNCFTRLNAKACAVGRKPGVTLCTSGRVKVSDHPLIYIFDTPGVLTPDLYVDRQLHPETVLKLALCECIPDRRVGFELMADYLLFLLNERGNASAYMAQLELSRPCSDVQSLLTHVARRYRLKREFNLYGQRGVADDFERAAKLFVNLFRSGLLGDQFLDDARLEAK